MLPESSFLKNTQVLTARDCGLKIAGLSCGPAEAWPYAFEFISISGTGLFWPPLCVVDQSRESPGTSMGNVRKIPGVTFDKVLLLLYH